MSTRKFKLRGKRVSWGYEFSIGPRGAAERYQQGGYATEKAAKDAEAAKRTEITRKAKIAATGTLGHAIGRFFDDRGAELSPKTLDRYRELVAYLGPDLLGMPIADVRAMDLHDEWKRLKASGGHVRGTKEARPLAAKTVRNIASVVSATCSWAVLYGLIATNPARDSKPPSGPKRKGIALAPEQTELLVNAADGWLADFLDVECGLGIRRGEALALRWSDRGKNPKNGNDAVNITRSLCQVKTELIWKGTKTGEERWVDLPATVVGAFERRRIAQVLNHADFPDYDVAADLIFCDPGGQPLRPDSVSAKVSLHFKRLKLTGSLHTLRHSHASQLVADGQDIAAISERMGHSDAGTTLGIYTHAVPGKVDLAKEWEKLQRGKVN